MKQYNLIEQVFSGVSLISTKFPLCFHHSVSLLGCRGGIVAQKLYFTLKTRLNRWWHMHIKNLYFTLRKKDWGKTFMVEMIAIKGTAHTFTHTYTHDKLAGETLGFVQVKQQHGLTFWFCLIRTWLQTIARRKMMTQVLISGEILKIQST